MYIRLVDPLFQHINYTYSKSMRVSLVLCLILPLAMSLRTLVILDNKNLESTHSVFIASLKESGPLDIKYSFDNAIQLSAYDQYKYDIIVVFCTSEQLTESAVNVNDLVDFFDNGGSLLVAGDLDVSRGFRKLFYSFGLELDEENIQVKDGFNYLEDHNTVVTTNMANVYPYVRGPLAKGGKLLYRGVGLRLADYVTNQLYALVKGQSTTYSYSHSTKQSIRAGEDITLVAAVQGLRNSRAVFTGSLDFFSDQFVNNKKYDNNKYVPQILEWVTKQSGIIRVSNISHYSDPTKGSQQVFTVTSRIHFQADVQEYNGKTDSWEPYVSEDLSVEFVMLDPWVIVRLNNTKGTKRYHAEFDAPTKEGIYQFKVIYEKPGFNFVKEISRVTLRPKRHDEFERFLLTAYPYYAGVWATILGTVVFIVTFLYSRTEPHLKTQEESSK